MLLNPGAIGVGCGVKNGLVDEIDTAGGEIVVELV